MTDTPTPSSGETDALAKAHPCDLAGELRVRLNLAVTALAHTTIPQSHISHKFIKEADLAIDAANVFLTRTVQAYEAELSRLKAEVERKDASIDALYAQLLSAEKWAAKNTGLQYELSTLREKVLRVLGPFEGVGDIFNSPPNTRIDGGELLEKYLYGLTAAGKTIRVSDTRAAADLVTELKGQEHG